MKLLNLFLSFFLLQKIFNRVKSIFLTDSTNKSLSDKNRLKDQKNLFNLTLYIHTLLIFKHWIFDLSIHLSLWYIKRCFGMELLLCWCIHMMNTKICCGWVFLLWNINQQLSKRKWLSNLVQNCHGFIHPFATWVLYFAIVYQIRISIRNIIQEKKSCLYFSLNPIISVLHLNII